jgi:hypothetical protein
MDWERIKGKLEPIFNAPLIWRKIPVEEWNKLIEAQSVSSKNSKTVHSHGKIYFLLEIQAGIALVLEIEEMQLTKTEKQLIELVLDATRVPEKAKPINAATEEEKAAYGIRDWVELQLAMNVSEAAVPDTLASQLSLHSTVIPILFRGGYSDSQHVNYKELKKLLESFFETGLKLIPLQEKEWLILGAESLLTASQGEEKESIEDALTSICFGLHEMLANEWMGECHLSIYYPQPAPAETLLKIIGEMRETIRLGEIYYPGISIHFLWDMQLEKLLRALPETEQLGFVAQILKRADQLPDTEMYLTLEEFFAHDCNVSETAKKLFIHRNTLIYRLDKFKQETGLDARSFNDAVLVKVALLLYKVTKRK